MAKENQVYCVVAEDRNAPKYDRPNMNKRIDLTGPQSLERAKTSLENFKNDSYSKKHYRYFKLAKYPYTDKR